jgi:gliding motility-associated-like protein
MEEQILKLFTHFTNLQPGFYDVVLKDETGCELIDIVEINEPAPLYFEEQLVHIACFGDATGQISFNASSGGIPPYTYSIDDGVTTQAAPIFSNLLAGSYKMTMLDANGCEWSKQVILTSPSELNSIITSTDLTCYQNNSGTITIEETTGGVVPYVVSFDGGQNFGQATSMTGLSVGDYFVVIQDENACTYNQTITINQPDELSVNEFVNDASCYGVCDASIGVLANGGTPPYTYQWEGEDVIQNSTEQLGICAGNYELNLTDVNGCALGVPFYLSSPDQIIADFYIPADEYSILASEVFFQNSSIGAVSYSWDFGDGSNLNYEHNPSHLYDDKKGRVYSVTLIASNEYGCNDTLKQIITIEDRLIYYIPNAFTPNGDEVNQTFKPVFNAGFTAEDFTLEIFNRYGELIFETRDPNMGWDGVYGDFIVPEGTYIWKVTLRERMTDRKVIDTGHVTVLK